MSDEKSQLNRWCNTRISHHQEIYACVQIVIDENAKLCCYFKSQNINIAKQNNQPEVKGPSVPPLLTVLKYLEQISST